MRLPGLLMLIVALAGSLGATPSTPAELADALQTAILARDHTALHQLLFIEHMSSTDIEKTHTRLDALIDGKGQLSVIPDRLSERVSFMRINRGFRIEPNVTPTGIIRIAWQDGRASTVNTLPCGTVGDRCLLTGITRTDLGWKGPPDHQLGFSLEDKPAGVHLIVVKYNVSGVDVEERYSSKSAAFEGQHIDELTITGITENFHGKLVVRDQSEPIFESPVLSGQTAFTYRRPQP